MDYITCFGKELSKNWRKEYSLTTWSRTLKAFWDKNSTPCNYWLMKASTEYFYEQQGLSPVHKNEKPLLYQVQNARLTSIRRIINTYIRRKRKINGWTESSLQSLTNFRDISWHYLNLSERHLDYRLSVRRERRCSNSDDASDGHSL